LYEALCEVAACFPVYRTYVRASDGVASEADIRYVTEAVQRAAAQRPDMDQEIFLFLGNLLLLRITGSLEGELAMRFQQLTGPAMAKGVEDTAFYRFNRLVSLNEVGGDPGHFGTSVAEFHRFCADALARRPLSLLATSTHDAKRSEDVRARLALLSEIPEVWSQAVYRWARRNARYRRDDMPDRNMEYFFYQTLVGAWPISTERMTAYMEKAAREAKAHTSWNQKDEAYEEGLRDFVSTVMDDPEFRADFEDFVARVVEPGRVNSLALTIIKLTAPGVPDIYQGSEVWNLSLVDPDNRRPVGFAQLAQLLADLEETTPKEVMARADEGLPKLWVIRQALWLRHERAVLFGAEGSYRPLEAKGAKADHVVAFMRGEGAVTVAPRLVVGLGGDWADTVLELPDGRWHNVLTDEEMEGGAVRLAEILARFPVGLLAREES
jgi:(1->4)-alpha-D-glucan 1-alpha-D-glucosylmutase